MGRIGGRPAVDYRRLAGGDVSDLSLGIDALGTDFRALHAELLTYGGYRAANVRRVQPTQLTPEWLQQSRGFRPVLVPAAPGAARDLGMALPEGHVTVDRLASKLGLPFEVHTVDVQTQGEGPRWTLHQWQLYWEARRGTAPARDAFTAGLAGAGAAAPAAAQGTPRRAAPAEDEADSSAVRRKRSAEEEEAARQLKGISAESKKRLLEVAALPLAGTALEGEVSPPTAVLAVDLAQQVWPEGAPSRPVAGVTLVMSPEGAYTDFHLAAGGASVWLHCVSGRRSLALVPPTPRNLATYAAWAASARYAGVFLPAHCEGTMKVEVGPGDTLIIPAGWAHASATTSSAILFGGSFLRRDALAMHLEAWRIEDHLAVRPRFRLPAFKQVMWYAAAAFSKRLRRLAGLSCGEVRERVIAQLAAVAAEEEAAAAAGGGSQGAGDSDSVSKAGAAKKRKGWAEGQGLDEADDARSRPPAPAGAAVNGSGPSRGAGGGGAGPPGAAQRSLQLPASLLARASGSPMAASGPRQIGRVVGGGSRLRRASGGGSGGGAAARAPARRLNPTQQTVDVRGGGGGGGGAGGGFARRKRQRSPDSFIDSDASGEAASGGKEDEDSDAEGAEWAPDAKAGASDEEMSDVASDDDAALDELAAAARRNRFGNEAVGATPGAAGAAGSRRMTARQAAREAANAAAWDGRLAARQLAAPRRRLDEFDDFEDFEDDVEWGSGDDDGAFVMRGRQSTRHGGKLPARLAAMLQEEEQEDEEAPPAAVHAYGAADPALAAFAAAQQPLQMPAASPAAPSGLKLLKLKVKAPVAAAGSAGAAAAWPGAPPAPVALFGEQPQQAQQVQQPPSARLKIKIKGPAGGSGQQPTGESGQPGSGAFTIPQVDGAGDDQLEAMYEALFEEGGEQQGQAGTAGAQQQAQQPALPAVLAAPLGQSPRQPVLAAPAQAPQAAAAAAAASGQAAQEGSDQQQAPGRQQEQRQSQQRGASVEGAAADDTGQAGAQPERQGSPVLAQHADSSQGQLATGGDDSAPGPGRATSLSPSIEGPAAVELPQELQQEVAAQEVGGTAAQAQAAGSSPAPDQAAVPALHHQEKQQREQQEQQARLTPGRENPAGHHPAGSSGAPSPAAMARATAVNDTAHAAEQQQQQQQQLLLQQTEAERDRPAVPAPPAPAPAEPAGADLDADLGDADVEGATSAPPEPLSLEEEDGLAALLTALRQWLKAPHALNDVPLSISNPKAVVARLEVCMRAANLSLQPPAPVDFESVPLERLLPLRTPRAGTLGMPPSHQTPQTGGGSEFVPGELDAVGELEDGGEFDPADLEEEGATGVVVEESAGPKHKLAAAVAAKQAGVRAGGSAGRGGAGTAPAPAKRQTKMSVKDRLKKKLHLK